MKFKMSVTFTINPRETINGPEEKFVNLLHQGKRKLLSNAEMSNYLLPIYFSLIYLHLVFLFVFCRLL